MSEHETHGSTAPASTDGEIGYGMLMKLGFGLLGLVLVAAALMYFLFAGFLDWEQGRQPEPPVLEEARARAPVPGALLLPVRDATGRPGASPEQNLEEYDAAAAERLHAYGWVDEGQEIAHIPIERAIELLATRGMAVARPAGESAEAMEGESPEGAAADATAPDAATPEVGESE